MKKLLLFLIGVFISSSIYSQAQLTALQDWSTKAGTQNFFYKNVTKTDGSGNVYVAGATLNGAGNYDVLLAKFNSSGVQQWIIQIDGSAGYQDFATALQLDGSGNVYITGAITNDTISMMSDLFFKKYNSSGVLQWTNTYDGFNLYDCGTDILVNTGGTMAVVGSSFNTSGNLDFVTIFYNSSGVQQWANRYAHSSGFDDVPVRIVKSGTGVAVAGAVKTGASSYSWAALVYRSNGVLNSTTISSGGTSGIEEVRGMVTDANGFIYLAGFTPTVSDGYDYDVIKLDSNLVIQWERTYDANGSDDKATAIQVSSTGDVYVTGYSNDNVEQHNYLTLKYNSSGSLIWTRTFNDSLNGDDEAYAMTMDNSGKIYITGNAHTSLSQMDYHTIKYDTAGTVEWSIDFDGETHLHDRATNIAIDPFGAIVVTGTSEITAGVYEYATVRYVQKNILTPTDYNTESASDNFSFYQNKGQILGSNDSLVPSVVYYTENAYPAYYIKKNSFSFVFSKTDTVLATIDTAHRVDVSFQKANTNVKTFPLEQRKDYTSYYFSHLGDGITKIHGNQRLVTPNLYPNIDLEYSSNQNGIKFYFIINPGGNPADIEPEFTGASSFNLNGTSNALTINASIGSLTFDRPTVYQLNSSNVIVPVTGWTADWQTNGASNKYKFNVGTYDSTKVLIIQVDQGNGTQAASAAYRNLTWSTYYGATDDEDKFSDLAADNNGDIYAAFETRANNFPTTTGISNPNGYNLTGAVKFNRFGVRQYSFYYGVNNDSQVPIIHAKLDVSSTGNVYLTGAIIRTPGYNTNIPFPSVSPVGSYTDFTIGDGSDVFLAKFGTTGFPLVWATYFGGDNYEDFPDVNIDNTDKIYLTFWGSSDSLLNKPGAYWDSLYHGSVIVKFNTSLQRIWATSFTGGINRATLDKNNDFYVTGSCSPVSYFPFTNPGGGAFFDSTFNGSNDIMLAKFGSSASDLKWATIYGGNGEDYANSIAADNNSGCNLYITGNTKSTNFPCRYAGTGTYIDTLIGGTADVFMAQFSPSLSLSWGTYFGGSSNGEKGLDVTTDPLTDNVFFTGATADNAITFFGSSAYYTQSFGGGPTLTPDAYILSFTPAKIPIWGSYLGYNAWDDGNAIVCNQWNQLFLAGSTQSTQTGNFLDMNPGGGAWFSNTYISGSSYDSHISRFTIDPSNQIGVTEHNIIPEGDLVVYPNPSNGLYNYKLSSLDHIVYLKIYNIIGELISIEKIATSNGLATGSFDISSFSNGVYFISAESAKTRKVKRIIKQ
ncbi:MAG TPA: SBBP repeat-containing protein [Flavobacterium sp.]|jgi:hypothetical protein